MILLTGGAGFIGSCLLSKLNNEGITDILVVDNLASSEKWKNLVGKKFTNYIHKDEFLKLLLEGKYEKQFTTIFHFGACSSTNEKNVDYLMKNNFQFSKLLCDYATRNDARFIYASSASTYGFGENGFSDESVENLRPLNPYGYSKQVFDEWVFANNLENFVTGLKFFNVFGPNEYHKDSMASMVYKAYLQIQETGKVKLFSSTDAAYKDGEQKRDFIYIKDVIDLIWNFYQADPNDNTAYGIYNIGSGRAQTWKQLVAAVFKSLGKRSKIEYIDMPEDLKSQYQNFTEADMSKLNDSNHTILLTSLEDGIKDYVTNYLQQEWKHL